MSTFVTYAQTVYLVSLSRFTKKDHIKTISHFINHAASHLMCLCPYIYIVQITRTLFITYHLLRNEARVSRSPSMNGTDRRRSEGILSLKLHSRKDQYNTVVGDR